jgi:predicted RNA-binding Zn-ribbon protein involved in translation (DUF1610 family)
MLYNASELQKEIPMEQMTRCNDCDLEWLVEVVDVEGDGEEFTCPNCGSTDTTCF